MYRKDLINAAMGAKRLTGQQLADMTKLSAFTISEIRNGSERVILRNLRKVADALEIKWSELFMVDEEQSEPQQKAA